MKTKSPISIDSIRFFTYNHDMDDELAFIDQFPYDDRHDFAVDRSFGGLAVKAEVSNYRGDKGARREVSFTLIDVSSRCEVAVKKLKINLGKDAYKDVFLHFTAETSGLTGGCTYRLVICDETASTTLGEEIVHLFGQEMRRHPAEWYEVADCGVRPAWEDNLYKSLNTVDDHDYFVRFNLVQKLGTRLPSIMPELELRLHYPGGKIVRSFFKEPWCRGLEDFNSGLRSVEYPFITFDDVNGVFYAELLCMEYPIAGFVFDTLSDTDVRGRWFGPEIQPMDEYSHHGAMERIDKYLPDRNKSEDEPEEDEFYEALERFIASELEEMEDSGNL